MAAILRIREGRKTGYTGIVSFLFLFFLLMSFMSFPPVYFLTSLARKWETPRVTMLEAKVGNAFPILVGGLRSFA